MSSKLINAVIALIEERPWDAREMLRSPEMKLPIGEVQAKVLSAVANRERIAQLKSLKAILGKSLQLQAPRKASEAEAESFLQGVAALEDIIEDYIVSLKA